MNINTNQKIKSDSAVNTISSTKTNNSNTNFSEELKALKNEQPSKDVKADNTNTEKPKEPAETKTIKNNENIEDKKLTEQDNQNIKSDSTEKIDEKVSIKETDLPESGEITEEIPEIDKIKNNNDFTPIVLKASDKNIENISISEEETNKITEKPSLSNNIQNEKPEINDKFNKPEEKDFDIKVKTETIIEQDLSAEAKLLNDKKPEIEISKSEVTEPKEKVHNELLTPKEEIQDEILIPKEEAHDELLTPKEVITGLENVVQEINKINRPNEKYSKQIKETDNKDDNKKVKNIEKKNIKIEIEKDIADTIPEDFKLETKEKIEDKNLIDNNMNVQDTKDKLLNPQMNANMSFNSNGQPFSEFINTQNKEGELAVNEKDLAEEKAVLSTMNENIAIANKNIAMAKAEKAKSAIPTTEEPQIEDVQPKTKTVVNEKGIKKVNRESNVTVETIVKYDTVVMDKADVEFFTNLVNNGEVDLTEVTNPQKATHVSKTLADLINKAMQENKPVRIDFDNDISVIIKISKDGKISADFLPSSQIAEAYLRENLPILRQKFDDNNIDYDELNQRKQKQDNPENRKKDRKNE